MCPSHCLCFKRTTIYNSICIFLLIMGCMCLCFQMSCSMRPHMYICAERGSMRLCALTICWYALWHVCTHVCTGWLRAARICASRMCWQMLAHVCISSYVNINRVCTYICSVPLAACQTPMMQCFIWWKTTCSTEPIQCQSMCCKCSCGGKEGSLSHHRSSHVCHNNNNHIDNHNNQNHYVCYVVN